MARTAVFGLGTFAGLVFALPVKTGSVSCPPQREGRVQCLINEAWAPAAIKLAAVIFAFWLLGEIVFRRVPALRRRWAEGERLVRHEDGMGHDVVVADPLLAAANRGIVPERRARWRVVRAEPSPEAAAAVAAAAAAPHRIAWPEPEPQLPVPASAPGVHALNAEERFARSSGSHGSRISILTADETRGRRLRRGIDTALVVSCWSDATSARSLPDDVRLGVPSA